MEGYMIPIGLATFGLLWGAVGAGFIIYSRIMRSPQRQVAAPKPGQHGAPA
jgi:hypothetical protein